MRTYGIGRENAFPRLEELADHVRAAGYLVPRFIREFGVYDSAVCVIYQKSNLYLLQRGVMLNDFTFRLKLIVAGWSH